MSPRILKMLVAAATAATLTVVALPASADPPDHTNPQDPPGGDPIVQSFSISKATRVELSRMLWTYKYSTNAKLTSMNFAKTGHFKMSPDARRNIAANWVYSGRHLTHISASNRKQVNAKVRYIRSGDPVVHAESTCGGATGVARSSAKLSVDKAGSYPKVWSYSLTNCYDTTKIIWHNTKLRNTRCGTLGLLVPILGLLSTQMPGPAKVAVGSAGAAAAVAAGACVIGYQSTIDNYSKARDLSPLEAATVRMTMFRTSSTKGLTWRAVYDGQVASDCSIIGKHC